MEKETTLILEKVVNPLLETPGKKSGVKKKENTVNPDYKPFSDWYDYDGLYELIARLMPADGTFVELGVLHGASLNGMAKHLHENGKDNCRLVGIDLFSKTPDWIAKAAGARPDKEKVANYLSWYPGVVEIIESDSTVSAGLYADDSVDAVFVDGDHSYEGCLMDMEAWWPKIKKGGFLLGHDLKREHTVGKAVYAFRHKYGVEEHLIYRVGQWCFVLLK